MFCRRETQCLLQCQPLVVMFVIWNSQRFEIDEGEGDHHFARFYSQEARKLVVSCHFYEIDTVVLDSVTGVMAIK
jgi:hypothetical protein